ncbi:hypothetical protein BDR04DRAFT_673896 [Suillus decipiens]|nr:hypothetical protein BDR04DRAFT_673896 [Suillus decipiens]
MHGPRAFYNSLASLISSSVASTLALSLTSASRIRSFNILFASHSLRPVMSNMNLNRVLPQNLVRVCSGRSSSEADLKAEGYESGVENACRHKVLECMIACI